MELVWNFEEWDACANVYSEFDSNLLLPSETEGTAPGDSSGPGLKLCKDTTFKFSPSFGKFPKDACGVKKVGTTGIVTPWLLCRPAMMACPGCLLQQIN